MATKIRKSSGVSDACFWWREDVLAFNVLSTSKAFSEGLIFESPSAIYGLDFTSYGAIVMLLP